MKGLLIKDILNLKGSYKANLIVLGFFIIFAYQSGDPSYLIAMMVMIMTMLSVTSMAYDDLAKWDVYALSMPISRKNVVQSKYILSILLSLSATLISTVISYTLILPRSDMGQLEFLVTAGVIFEVSLLYSFITLPLIYKYGLEKVRILMAAVFAIPTFLVFFIYKMEVSLPSEEQMMFFLKISPLLVILALFVSMATSYRIFKKKDI